MELKEARYILAIEHYKSISKAAKALYISQPSLSKYLKGLEERLNAPLFSRIHNNYVPTYVGERYLSYARKMIECHGEWMAEFNDLMNLKKGSIHISIPMNRSASLIPESIQKFHKYYPDIMVNIIEGAHSAEKLLQEDPTVDLAVYSVISFPKNLDYEILGKAELVLVAPAGHWIGKQARPKEGFGYPWVDIRQLKEEPFIQLYPQQTTGQLVSSLFRKQGFSPKVWMQTRVSEVAVRMAIMGMGVTMTTEDYYRHMDDKGEGECFSVGKERQQTTLIAAYRKGQYLPEHVKKYISIMAERGTQ